MAAAALALASATSAGLYFDGKYHLSKDLRILRIFSQCKKMWEVHASQKRISTYYIFEENCAKRRGCDCIWTPSRTYTWDETYAQVNKYANWFRSQGVRPNDLVALYCHNSAEMLLMWLGLGAIGAGPAMVNYNLAGKALVSSLKASRAKLLLVDEDEEFRQRILDAKSEVTQDLEMTVVVVNTDFKTEVEAQSTERPPDRLREVVQPDWPFALFYTSGTTGTPKACPFRSDRFFSVVTPFALGLNYAGEDDRVYNCMPMYHGTGGLALMTQIINGRTVCIGRRFSTRHFWEDIQASRATWFTYVGEVARYLLAAPPSPLDRSHAVRGMYGNGLRPDVWLKFKQRFGIQEVVEFFTSTEGVLMLSNHSKGDVFAGAVGHQGLILRLLTRNLYAAVETDPSTGAIVRDSKTGYAVRKPFSVGGEIIVKAADANVFAGYLDNEEATAKKFARDVFKKGDLWYRSGDALRRDEDGLWHFVDRLGDTFRWKGENVSTAEVQEVLGEFGGIQEANVYGVQLPGHDGRAGCAALCLDSAAKQSFDYAALFRYARKRLPRYAVPIFLRIVPAMEHSHNNKQNKVRFREEGVDWHKIASYDDEMLYVPAGSETYCPYTEEVWNNIVGGKVRL